jgi:hypothetical protein
VGKDTAPLPNFQWGASGGALLGLLLRREEKDVVVVLYPAAPHARRPLSAAARPAAGGKREEGGARGRAAPVAPRLIGRLNLGGVRRHGLPLLDVALHHRMKFSGSMNTLCDARLWCLPALYDIFAGLRVYDERVVRLLLLGEGALELPASFFKNLELPVLTDDPNSLQRGWLTSNSAPLWPAHWAVPRFGQFATGGCGVGGGRSPPRYGTGHLNPLGFSIGDRFILLLVSRCHRRL